MEVAPGLRGAAGWCWKRLKWLDAGCSLELEWLGKKFLGNRLPPPSLLPGVTELEGELLAKQQLLASRELAEGRVREQEKVLLSQRRLQNKQRLNHVCL